MPSNTQPFQLQATIESNAETDRYNEARDGLEKQKKKLCDDYNKPTQTHKTPEMSRAFKAALDAINRLIKDEEDRHFGKMKAIADKYKGTQPPPPKPNPRKDNPQKDPPPDSYKITLGPGRSLRFWKNDKEVGSIPFGKPAGWQYQTSSNFDGGIGLPIPLLSGVLSGGSLVVALSRGSQYQKQNPHSYRLLFGGFGGSVGPDWFGKISFSASLESFPSTALGSVCCLPGAPPRSGEAGPPTGFAGPYVLISVGAQIGYGSSWGVFLLGGYQVPGVDTLLNMMFSPMVAHFFKYGMAFAGMGVGMGAGLSVTQGVMIGPYLAD